jgi:hypothetical protein
VAGDDSSRLDGFIDRRPPGVAATARIALGKLRTRYPAALQLIYDNYNALVIGFSSSERASDAVFSIALYPRWVTLFFLEGVELEDPERRLQGSGNVVRSIRLDEAATELDDRYVRGLMARALKNAGTTLKSGPKGRVVVKSVSKNQRRRARRDFRSHAL